MKHSASSLIPARICGSVYLEVGMTKCNVCGQPRSAYIMNNKSVCLKCDELLFNLEIECDEEVAMVKEPKVTPAESSQKCNTNVQEVSQSLASNVHGV